MSLRCLIFEGEGGHTLAGAGELLAGQAAVCPAQEVDLTPVLPAGVSRPAGLGEAMRGRPAPGGWTEGEAGGRALPATAGDEASLGVGVPRVRELGQGAEVLTQRGQHLH